jgi:hypothetical protein
MLQLTESILDKFVEFNGDMSAYVRERGTTLAFD